LTGTRLLKMGMGINDGPQIVGGRGVRLQLDDGREVIDAATTPAPLGHRHPRVIEAVVDAARAAPTLDEGWTTPTREAAAEMLLGTVFAGEDWVGAVRFALTGSEANDLALSLSQALTGRGPVATRERAYHGLVGLSRDVTVQPQWHGGLSDRDGDVRPVPAGVEVRALPFPRGSFGDGLTLTEDAAHEVLAGADAQLQGTAAVIVDYTQGGCYPAPAYQDVLGRKARAAGTLWIADEVITGFGKAGRWLNFQRGTERPDMVTLGKPMGGGVMPVAALVVSKDVLERMADGSWQNYSSLRSTDLGAAAALAFMRVVAEEDLVARADYLHDVVVAGMRKLANAHPCVSRVDGRGLHWWIEIGDSDWRQWEGTTADAPLAIRVARRVLDAGTMVATSGESNVLLVTLPMIIGDGDVQAMLQALDHGLELADREPAGSVG
jgi:4-aminobutyrate aminotransferase-like enzyme